MLASLLFIFASLQCDQCDVWNEPQAPFKIFGNTYYVGVRGLSSVLVTSPKGHVLLDAGLPQSAPRIAENIRKLGFRVEDIRLIVISHAHFDHAGGVAELQQSSGARVAASAWSAGVLRTGQPLPDDPQASIALPYPAVSEVQVVAAGEKVSAGDLSLTMIHSPGHTPGSASWMWRSCEAKRCRDVVYADSLTPVSEDSYRFTPQAKTFEDTIKCIAALPCDILVTPHPDFSDTFEKQARKNFVDPKGCRSYAEASMKRLRERLDKEAR